MEVRRNLIDGRNRRILGRQLGRRWASARKACATGSCGTAVKGGVGDDILLLGDTIPAQGLEDVLLGEPCVEDAPASAHDILGCCLGPSEAPRYAHTRGPIHVV